MRVAIIKNNRVENIIVRPDGDGLLDGEILDAGIAIGESLDADQRAIDSAARTAKPSPTAAIRSAPTLAALRAAIADYLEGK